jgi:hypothetical protein
VSAPEQLGGEALKGMSAEAIVAALEVGRLEEYMAGEPVAAAPVPEVEQYGSAWTVGKTPQEVDAALHAGHLRAYLAGEIT